MFHYDFILILGKIGMGIIFIWEYIFQTTVTFFFNKWFLVKNDKGIVYIYETFWFGLSRNRI